MTIWNTCLKSTAKLATSTSPRTSTLRRAEDLLLFVSTTGVMLRMRWSLWMDACTMDVTSGFKWPSMDDRNKKEEGSETEEVVAAPVLVLVVTDTGTETRGALVPGLVLVKEGGAVIDLDQLLVTGPGLPEIRNLNLEASHVTIEGHIQSHVTIIEGRVQSHVVVAVTAEARVDRSLLLRIRRSKA